MWPLGHQQAKIVDYGIVTKLVQVHHGNRKYLQQVSNIQKPQLQQSLRLNFLSLSLSLLTWSGQQVVKEQLFLKTDGSIEFNSLKLTLMPIFMEIESCFDIKRVISAGSRWPAGGQQVTSRSQLLIGKLLLSQSKSIMRTQNISNRFQTYKNLV